MIQNNWYESSTPEWLVLIRPRLAGFEVIGDRIAAVAEEGWAIATVRVNGNPPGITEPLELAWTWLQTDLNRWGTTTNRYSGTVSVNRNKEVVIGFQRLAPRVPGFYINASTNMVLRAILEEDGITIYPGVSGVRPMIFQWLKDGVILPGATNEFLTLNRQEYSSRGFYTVRVTNSFRSIESAPIDIIFPANVHAFTRNSFGKAQPITNSVLSFTGEASVELASNIPGALIFYTVDGSEPSWSSLLYTSPLKIGQSGILKAKAYSSDLTDSVILDAITFSVGPPLNISVLSPATAQVGFSKPGPYGLGELVAISAVTPFPEARFISWSGSFIDTNQALTISVQSNLLIHPVFGVEFRAIALGGGRIVGVSSSNIVPLSAIVKLEAVPNSGFGLVRWGGDAPGTNSPLTISNLSRAMLVTALFEPLPATSISVTTIATGYGHITTDPNANIIEKGTEVRFTAHPSAGQTFLGWEGLDSMPNPLTLTGLANLVITGRFSTNVTLRISEFPFLSVAGVDRKQTVIESSSHLTNWSPVFHIPVLNGGSTAERLWPILSATNTAGFFRARQE